MKKIMSLLLAVCMVLCLLPAVVLADGGTSEITSVDATIKPILGAKIGTYATQNFAQTHIKKLTTVPAEPTTEGLYINYVTWWKIPDADYTGDVAVDEGKMTPVTDEDEVFQDGYHYYVVAEFADYDDATSSYLPFTEAAYATINGKAASSRVLEVEGWGNIILSVAGYVDVAGFYDIDMTVAAPAVGATPDYRPTFEVTDDVYEAASDLGVTTVEATTWYKVAKADYKGVNGDNWTEMEASEAYTSDYYYMVKFNIKESNDSRFDWLWRTISTRLTGSLNGKAFDRIVVADDQYSAELYKCFGPEKESRGGGSTNYYVVHTYIEGEGTVDPVGSSGSKMVRSGEDEVFTFTPAAGYEIGDVVVNGKSVGAVSSYTVKDIDHDTNIEITFVRNGTAVVGTGNANPATGAML